MCNVNLRLPGPCGNGRRLKNKGEGEKWGRRRGRPIVAVMQRFDDWVPLFSQTKKTGSFSMMGGAYRLPIGLTAFLANQHPALAGTGYDSVGCCLCCGDFLPLGKEDLAFGLPTYRGVVSLITLSSLVQGNVKNPQFSGGYAAIFERCHKDTSIAGRLKVRQPDWLAALLCSFCAIVNKTVLFTIALKHDATCPL